MFEISIAARIGKVRNAAWRRFNVNPFIGLLGAPASNLWFHSSVWDPYREAPTLHVIVFRCVIATTKLQTAVKGKPRRRKADSVLSFTLSGFWSSRLPCDLRAASRFFANLLSEPTGAHLMNHVSKFAFYLSWGARNLIWGGVESPCTNWRESSSQGLGAFAYTRGFFLLYFLTPPARARSPDSPRPGAES